MPRTVQQSARAGQGRRSELRLDLIGHSIQLVVLEEAPLAVEAADADPEQADVG